jgi:hypothetical protein
MSSSWAEFAAAVPDMAAAGQRLFYQHGLYTRWRTP